MINFRGNRRVVVTGMGVVTSIGVGIDEFWKNLLEGKSGISVVESFDTSKHATHKGGEIKNFNPCSYISPRKRALMGKASQLAIVAARLALDEARLDVKKLADLNIGISLGSTSGESQEIEAIDEIWSAQGEEKVGVHPIMQYPVDNIPSNLAHALGVKGPISIFTTACAAGNYSIGNGFDMIMTGRVDKMLVGGSDAFSYSSFTGFNQLGAVAPDKCQPFDKNRKGMIPAEGASVLVLETLEDALKRKANIYAEILGYGLSCDAEHITNPSSEGIAQCMQSALRGTGLVCEDVDYICAHGTGTRSNDVAESAAIRKVFGDKRGPLPVSSIKSMLGHTMGAASAIEAVACCLTVKNDMIAPTINFETPDPACAVDCVPNRSRQQVVHIALNNAFAFGGNNSCLVIRKFEKDA
ncbi:MAG: beta-ketoacyl-[acyl-carrier-protein] synthase family protein [Candidatus Omnitrophica bacterium]|nr:beta-ketoacyl-[acyl-carrier-protein] synthase family protein [Candidatus Omnitrophota bacterium]